MNIQGKRITILGLQKTGAALAGFLAKRGALITVSDRSDESALGDKASIIRSLGINLETGGHSDASFENKDYIILSPGVPHTLPQLEKARQKGVSVIGEVEVAAKFIDCPIIAITGTNGKSTATTLAGEMLKKSGFNVFVGGNLGTPLVSCLDLPEKPDFVVAEISSFQLDTCESFRPKAAVLLNITEDHLDRYKDINGYADSKMTVFKNQNENDFAILNAADRMTIDRISGIASTKYFFNESNPSEYSADFRSGELILKSGAKGQININISKYRLKGIHNLENLAAASLSAWLVGATRKGIQEAVNSFRGLPHRVEFCGEINGVGFYDDSKATNIDAALRAVEGFEQPLAIIMGGRDKGATFELMIEALKKNTVKAVLIGEAAEKIKRAFNGEVETVIADSMEDAVLKAFEAVRYTGGAVILSPACASFDMFENYGHRGKAFRESAGKVILEAGGHGK